MLLSLAVGAVIIIAALTAYLVGFLSGDDTNAPVTVDSVQTGVEEVEEEVTGLPVLLTPMRATIEGASAPELVDADRSTTWTGSDNVSVELRPAKGATARKGFTLEHVIVDTPSNGDSFRIYGLPAGASWNGDVADLPLLKEGTFLNGENGIDVEDSPELTGLVLNVSGQDIILRDVTLIGRTSLR